MGYNHHTLAENLRDMEGVKADYYGSDESWHIEIEFGPDQRHRVQTVVGMADGIQCTKTKDNGNPRQWVIEPDGKTR